MRMPQCNNRSVVVSYHVTDPSQSVHRQKTNPGTFIALYIYMSIPAPWYTPRLIAKNQIPSAVHMTQLNQITEMYRSTKHFFIDGFFDFLISFYISWLEFLRRSKYIIFILLNGLYSKKCITGICRRFVLAYFVVQVGIGNTLSQHVYIVQLILNFHLPGQVDNISNLKIVITFIFVSKSQPIKTRLRIQSI